MTITSDYEADAIHQAIVAAAQEIGLPLNADYNGPEQVGVSYMQFNIKHGVRHSTAVAYLNDVADHSNLRVLLRAHARRLLFAGSRCTGVEWSRNGRTEHAEAPEVVVAGGALGSPQLLLLSGVGPSAQLAEHGIEVVADLPGVGENLHDHLLSPVIFAARRQVGLPSPGLPACQTHLFWRSRPELAVPDVQPIHFMVPMYEAWMSGPENGFTLMSGMIRPQSRGSLRLSGPSPEDPLLIDPNILACTSDVDSLVAGVRLVRRMGATDALQAWGAVEQYPGPGMQSDEDARRYVRDTAITYHHQAGTCKMGRDAMAVVDSELRVHGIDGLRVADASIMPAVTTGNTNAPSIMIGERCADFVSGWNKQASASSEAPA